MGNWKIENRHVIYLSQTIFGLVMVKRWYLSLVTHCPSHHPVYFLDLSFHNLFIVIEIHQLVAEEMHREGQHGGTA